MSFPSTRMRRMRADDFSRRLMRETVLTPDDFIWPVFVIEGEDCTEKVESMPGVERMMLDRIGEEVARAIAEDTENSIRTVGGPQVFRRREIAELAFATLGWPVKIKTRPNWMVKMIAWVLRPYNANLSALIHFLAFSFENEDMTGEPLGKRQLKDFFAELAPEYTGDHAAD